MHVRSALTTSERRQQRHAYPPTKAYLSHAYLAYKLSLMPVRSALTRLAYRTLTGLEGHAYPTYKPLLMPVRSTLITLTNPCLPRHRRLLTGLEGRAYSTHEPLLTPVRSALTTLERRQQTLTYPCLPAAYVVTNAYLPR